MFGNRLQLARKARWLSLRGLAARTSFSFGYVNKVERGERPPNAAFVVEAARALNHDVDEWLSLTQLLDPALGEFIAKTPGLQAHLRAAWLENSEGPEAPDARAALAALLERPLKPPPPPEPEPPPGSELPPEPGERVISRDQAKAEVLAYFQANVGKSFYPGDVAKALGLDPEAVLELVEELINDGLLC